MGLMMPMRVSPESTGMCRLPLTWLGAVVRVRVGGQWLVGRVRVRVRVSGQG